jgi:hypothetical protein
MKPSFKNSFMLVITLTALIINAFGTSPVYAAALIVNSNVDDTLVNLDANSTCDLREAITNANNNAATYSDCAAGSGTDTITFNASYTITLTSALPEIFSGVLTINGGLNTIVIDGANLYRGLEVAAGAVVNISSLTIQHGLAGSGAGIYNDGTLTVTDSTFSNNKATVLSGGGIYNIGTLIVTNSSFLSNSANYGGGIVNLGNTTVEDSTFSNNTVAASGGGIYGNTNGGSTTLIVKNSTFSNNAASDYGGGIANISTLTVTNSTFSGNTATSGGGLYNNDGTVIVINSTFANNSASDFVGGIYGISTTTGTTTLKNTIVANSASQNGGNCNNTIIADSHNLDTDDTCGLATVTTSIAIKLGSFTDNGGATYTFALLTGSPAIDAGDPAVCADVNSVNNLDQRGETRPIDGDTVNGAICDIGSYEAEELDTAAPTVTINKANSQADPTNTSPIQFTVIFNEVVTGFTAGDVSISGIAGTPSVSVTGTGPTYTVSVSGMVNGETITASIPANAAKDAANNNSMASTSTDNSVIYDTNAPTVTLNKASGQADPANTTPIQFTVIFNEVVTGFTAGDVSISGIAGTPSVSVTGTGPTYTVSVSGMVNGETVTASIPANAVKDAANNNSMASTSTDNSIVYETSAPAVTINKANSQADPTNASPIQFTVIFNEVVTGFTAGDVSISGVAGTPSVSVTGTGPTYTVSVSGMVNGETVTASIPANAAKDAANNNSMASTSTDNSVIYDANAPTVTLNKASGQADPANTTPIMFTATFSEAVTGFDQADVMITGIAGTPSVSITGTGPIYTVSVSGMVNGETVTASIPANSVKDAADNDSVASTSSDNSVIYDTSAPTVTINKANSQADPANTTPILFTATFSEAVTGFDQADVIITGIAGTPTIIITGSGTTYTVSVDGMVTGETVTASVPVNAAQDAANNNSSAATSSDNSVIYSTDVIPSTILVNSILPTSRSIPVGATATIFNTIINSGSSTAVNVTLSMNPLPAGTFVYQQTNCATNAILGSPNPSLDITPGGVLCYILSFTPSATFAATSVQIQAQAANAPSTSLLSGINTWLLRSTNAAEPDIIALTTTTDFHQTACSGVNAFAVALSNVGVTATGDITVSAHTGSVTLPLSITIMETNPATGDIIGDNILQTVGQGENRTVGVFVGFNGCINFDPAVNRIFIEFRDASNNVVGSTSTAVSTNR